jgi:hypothetical protein
MVLSRRVCWKGLIATCVGLPGTFIILPAVLVVIIGGIHELLKGNLEEPLLWLSWGLAGFAGLCGFWIWIFLRPNSRPRVRKVVRLCILVGICAAAPFVLIDSFRYNFLLSTAAAIGVVVGSVIYVWLVLPNSPLNPDAPHDRRAG